MEEEKAIQKSMAVFMKGKAEDVKEFEEVVTTRYRDEKGNVVKFKFRPIPTERIQELQEECKEPVMKKGKKIDEKLNTKRFGARLGIETTVYPDFKDKTLLDSYKVVDPVDLVPQILSVGGEYAAWIEIVQRANGFDEDFNELVDEAKN